MTYKILYLYPDILDLYGDSGNIEVLKYRLKKRNIECVVDTYSINDPKPDFSSYNLIFMGGGADKEQQILSDDLNRFKKDIKKAISSGVFVLLICGGYQLFGSYYKDSDGVVIKGLGIFDYYTESSLDKKNRSIGNIIIDTSICGKVIGFENHGGLTRNVSSPFGKILYKNKNNFDDYEGFMIDNVIGTYLHGPLLSKNPLLADYIIKVGLEYNYDDVCLEPIDDELENSCRDVLFDRFLG